jgi:hypothetical protein
MRNHDIGGECRTHEGDKYAQKSSQERQRLYQRLSSRWITVPTGNKVFRLLASECRDPHVYYQ